MAKIKKEFLQTLKSAADIATIASRYTKMSQKGADWWGRCPFPDHQETHPSFKVSPSRGNFKCFGCGKAGDAVELIMALENTGFQEAVEIAAQSAGLPVEFENGLSGDTPKSLRSRLFETHEILQSWFKEQINRPENRPARDYIRKSRNFSLETIRARGFGFAPHNLSLEPWNLIVERFGAETAGASGLFYKTKAPGAPGMLRWSGRLMLPLPDAQGRVCAFIGRVIPGAQDNPSHCEAKYITSSNTPIYNKKSYLYNWHEALKNPPPDYLRHILVEGNLDAIRCSSLGFKHTFAAQGTEISEEQVRLLASLPRGILCLFDGDAPGLNAAFKLVPLCLKSCLDMRFARLNRSDPDTLFRGLHKEIAAGILQKLHQDSLSPVEFAVRHLQQLQQNPAAPQQIQNIVSQITSWLAASPFHTLVINCIHELAALLQLDPAPIWEDFKQNLRLHAPPDLPGTPPEILQIDTSRQRLQTLLDHGQNPEFAPMETLFLKITGNTVLPTSEALNIIMKTKQGCDTILAHKDLLSLREISRIEEFIQTCNRLLKDFPAQPAPAETG
ncbi:CHC2 zinc finger domain-containing protein [Termitidicoccus mucosus]|uniref:DNA primase n=1 Tax=Termitidicoccus mucosus TaxID=1184151 RepID=A0A178IPG0_9BACT|nr:hypothetical protein AW736_02070 [Opitutaceae bacterium TSB47]